MLQFTGAMYAICVASLLDTFALLGEIQIAKVCKKVLLLVEQLLLSGKRLTQFAPKIKGSPVAPHFFGDGVSCLLQLRTAEKLKATPAFSCTGFQEGKNILVRICSRPHAPATVALEHLC